MVGRIMFKLIMRLLLFLVTVALCFQPGFSGSVASATQDTAKVKELNFVFLHGAGGNACAMQLLADSVVEQLPEYILGYEQANPGIRIHVDTLNRCYPNDVDIDTWAHNIASSINNYLPGKGDIILIGHSMGGKSAIHAVARNIGNLADRVALVVTINSPIKNMDKYVVTGGGSVINYCRARWLRSDEGVCTSVAYYDSSEDGRWVSDNKHWLAFISGEDAPLSHQFNFGGVDPYPRDMDDGAIPLSAQYSGDADTVYYGEYGHSDFEVLDDVAGFMVREILQYIFGGSIACSVFDKGGSFEHKAGWLLGTDYWQDIVGDIPAKSGVLWHKNQSYTKWQEWEDVVEYYPPTYEKYKRSRYEISRVRSSAVFTSIEELRWLDPDTPGDFRLYLRTRAAPRNYLQVNWEFYRQGLLLMGLERDHYEIAIVAGTPLAGIEGVSWITDDLRDLRVRIQSSAERPFRWFEAEWRVYHKENRHRKVIDEIPVLPGATPAN